MFETANPAPGHKIAMPNPLSEGLVDYEVGSPKTVQQYAKDISAFLMWAAEPKLEDRKRLGFRVLNFLIVYAGFLRLVKKKIWSRAKGRTRLALGRSSDGSLEQTRYSDVLGNTLGMLYTTGRDSRRATPAIGSYCFTGQQMTAETAPPSERRR
jgi:hypothetical protein